MKHLIILSLILMMAGCKTESKFEKSIDAGELVGIYEIPTSWNDSVRSRIVTTNGVFFVRRLMSSITGSSVRIDQYDDGRQYICIEGRTKCPQIIN